MNNEDLMSRNRIFIHLPLMAYIVLIFVLSSIPSLSPPELGIDAEDKIAHCIEYAVLGALIVRSMMAVRNPITTRLLMMAWALGALYGVTDEIHQYFVPNRFASPWDALADAVGVALGVVGYWRFQMKRNSKQGRIHDEVE